MSDGRLLIKTSNVLSLSLKVVILLHFSPKFAFRSLHHASFPCEMTLVKNQLHTCIATLDFLLNRGGTTRVVVVAYAATNNRSQQSQSKTQERTWWSFYGWYVFLFILVSCVPDIRSTVLSEEKWPYKPKEISYIRELLLRRQLDKQVSPAR